MYIIAPLAICRTLHRQPFLTEREQKVITASLRFPVASEAARSNTSCLDALHFLCSWQAGWFTLYSTLR